MSNRHTALVYDHAAGKALMTFLSPLCPDCDSYVVSGGLIRIALGRAFQLASCPACGRSWVESIPAEEALAFLRLSHRPVSADEEVRDA